MVVKFETCFTKICVEKTCEWLTPRVAIDSIDCLQVIKVFINDNKFFGAL